MTGSAFASASSYSPPGRKYPDLWYWAETMVEYPVGGPIAHDEMKLDANKYAMRTLPTFAQPFCGVEERGINYHNAELPPIGEPVLPSSRRYAVQPIALPSGKGIGILRNY